MMETRITKVMVELSLYEADLIRILRQVEFGEVKLQAQDDKVVRVKKRKSDYQSTSEPYQVIIERSELLTQEGGIKLPGATVVVPHETN